MKKKRGFASFTIIIFISLIIFSASFVSSSIAVGNPDHAINTLYSPGDPIIGWVNISLNSEPTNAILTSSLGGSISLIDLLNKPSNSGFSKSCDLVGCVSGYAASNPATSKVLNLGENQSVLVGFRIDSGSSPINLLSSISEFTFNLSSNNPETEKFPLAIDILNDGTYEWNDYMASSNFGSENRGCFGVATGQADVVSTTYYCERMRIERTPQVEIGGYIEGNTPGVMFSMKITSVDGSQGGSCVAGPTLGGATQGTERVSCVVPSLSVNKETDYFVCMKAASSSGAYKINIENSNICGFSSASGTYPGSYNYNFDLFARPKLYAGNIAFTLNDAELKNAQSPIGSSEQYIKNYITSVYANNCSNGCVIPVKIYSGVNQQITLSDTYGPDIVNDNPRIISYVAGIATTTDQFYDVAETPALMTAEFQQLYLGESGFNVPLQNGDNTFSLILNDSSGQQTLFSEGINVGGSIGIKSLTPTTTSVKYPTTFTVILNGTINGSKYQWDFGDGKNIQNTTTNQVSHTYDSSGSYMMKVTVFSLSGTVLSFTQANITVAPASQVVPQMLSDAQTKLSNIAAESQNFSVFEQKAINSSLGLNQIASDVNRLQKSASRASSEADFESIFAELQGMKIPDSIGETAYANGIGFYPQSENIDLNALQQVSGDTYDLNKQGEYNDAILSWEAANTNMVLTYSEISAVYSGSLEPVVKVFDMTIDKSSSESDYLLIKNLANLQFKSDYSQKSEAGYYYIPLNNQTTEIVFSTTDNVDFVNLPAFIAPPINQLSLNEWSIWNPETWGQWAVFIVIIIGIILLLIVVWIILQIWYRRRYENHLFKNRNNLLNLINYIQNQKDQGLNERDISSKLKRTGWTGEQIAYALKKYSGKRTGMLELISTEKLLKEKSGKKT